MISFLSATPDLSSLLSDVSSIVTSAISWCTSFIGEITSQPLLLLVTLMSLSLFGIHILKSLMGR